MKDILKKVTKLNKKAITIVLTLTMVLSVMLPGTVKEVHAASYPKYIASGKFCVEILSVPSDYCEYSNGIFKTKTESSRKVQMNFTFNVPAARWSRIAVDRKNSNYDMVDNIANFYFGQTDNEINRIKFSVTPHDWSNLDGVCKNCKTECSHDEISNGVCTTCGKVFHNHSFTYTVSGNTITAKCSSTCTDDTYKTGYGITLSVPNNSVYNGNSIGATLSKPNGLNEWPQNGITNLLASKPVIKYNGGSTVPTNAGTYTASVSVGGETVLSSYTIGQKEVVLSWSNNSLTYNGAEQAPTATVKNKAKTTDVVNVTVTGGKTDVSSTAYTATASALTGTHAGNYKLPSPNPTQNFTISPKTLSNDMISFIGNSSFVYDGNSKTVQPIVKFNNAALFIGKDFQVVSADTTMSASDASDSYLIKISGMGNFTGEASKGWSISKADTAVSENPTITNTLTYGDALSSAVFSGGKVVIKDTETEVPGTFAFANGTTVPNVADSNVTEYDVVFTPTDSVNYKPVTFKMKVTVNAKTLTKAMLSLNTSSFVYGTDAKTPTLTVADGTKTLVKNTDYSLDSTSENSGVNVKTYTIKVNGTGNYTGSATISWDITKANSTLTAPTAKTLTYNGTTQTLLNAGTSVVGGTLKYSLTQTGEYSETIPTKKDAGNYTVWYKVFGDDNHNDTLAASIPVTIAQREITISNIKVEDKTYDGNTASTLDYTQVNYGNIVSGEELSVTATGTFFDKNVGNNKTVAISNIALKEVTGNNFLKNYKLASGQQTTATANITKKDIATTITPNGGTYASTITAATASLNNTVSGDVISPVITYTGSDNAGVTYTGGTIAPTNAGEYDITVTLDGNDKDNYNLTGTVTDKFIVKQVKAENVNVTVDKLTFTYDEETEHEVIFTLIHDGDNADPETLELDKDFTTFENAEAKVLSKATDPGKYTLTIKLQGNYTGTITKNWSINKVIGTPINVKLGDENEKYDGTLTVTTSANELAPVITVNNPTSVLSEDDLNGLKDGTLDIDVIITADSKDSDSLDEDSVKEISKVANTSNIRYLDITIDKVLKHIENKKVVDVETIPVTETKEDVEITIDVPKSIPGVANGYKRTYTIIRSHLTEIEGEEGTDPTYIYKAEKLDTKYSNGKLSFKTNLFSDYAVTYVDTYIPIPVYKAPNTNVSSTISSKGFVELGAIAIGSMIGIISSKKKKEHK